MKLMSPRAATAARRVGRGRKQMVCVQCTLKIVATIVQAKTHGWDVWVGGARCKSCLERRGQKEGDR